MISNPFFLELQKFVYAPASTCPPPLWMGLWWVSAVFVVVIEAVVVVVVILILVVEEVVVLVLGVEIVLVV